MLMVELFFHQKNMFRVSVSPIFRANQQEVSCLFEVEANRDGCKSGSGLPPIRRLDPVESVLSGRENRSGVETPENGGRKRNEPKHGSQNTTQSDDDW